MKQDNGYTELYLNQVEFKLNLLGKRYVIN